MLLILCFAPFMSILFPYCYSFLGNSRPLIKHILHRSVVVLEKGQMAIITLCASIVLIISGGQKRFGLKKVGAGEWTFNENLHNQNRVFWLFDGELELLAHVTLLSSTTFENRRIEIKSEVISLITERAASGSA